MPSELAVARATELVATFGLETARKDAAWNLREYLASDSHDCGYYSAFWASVVGVLATM